MNTFFKNSQLPVESDVTDGTSIELKLPRPLEGIRIVECGVWHAGPGAAAILADLGAEVIKVETLTGDPERRFGGFGLVNSGDKAKPNWNLLFEFSNRNKKAICVDTTREDGRAILNELVKSADVFLTNLRQSVIPKVGLDFQSMLKINPKIIYLNVTGFGPKGPMKNVGGFDPMGQAISGMMFLAGQEEPVWLQAIVLDQVTAITASHAILTALLARQRYGVGQEIHASLYGSAIWMMHANLLTTSVLNENVQLKWDRMKNPVLRNNYKCKDGKWITCAHQPEEAYWPAFCNAIGQKQLESDPRFATKVLRAKYNLDILLILDDVLLTRPRAEWLQIFQEYGLQFAPVQNLLDVLEDPQAHANGYIVDFDHPLLGKIRIPGYPVSFSANTAGTHGPAPDLGEHTVEVLSGLGYSSEAIDRLKAEHVVR
jgi:crotonobetainyl-CoA:carnitine CoA-transferase CaiB-like acyl-CoA transferase